MKNKQTYLTRGSFALLLFVLLGYMVKFYPEQLLDFDTTVQTALRGDLPLFTTRIFTGITTLVNTPVVVSWVLILVAIFYYKKWKSEALLLGGNLVGSGLLILLLKNIYQRPRPAILHLVTEHGYSFPSGHALAATLVFGSLFVICQQRLTGVLKISLQTIFLLLMVMVILSRPYLGVHYPSDVLAGLMLGLGVLQIEYPFYDELRFKWRFTRKQK